MTESDDKTNELLLVALAEMSESCEAPELTPTCPYFVITRDVPSCGEECMDLLAGRGGDPRPKIVLTLGDGLEVRRLKPPRPRRAQSSPRPLFDAQEILLRDETAITKEKRTSSLLLELRQLVIMPAFLADDREDRDYRLKACWEELNSRQIPVERISATMFAPMMAFTYVAVCTATGAPADVRSNPGYRAWQACLDQAGFALPKEVGDEAAELMVDLDGEMISRLTDLFADLSLTSLLDGTPPSELPPPSTARLLLTEEDCSPERWLHDRLTATYVADWAPASRAFEWQYLHGQRPGCAPNAVMEERYVGEDELTPYLAADGATALLGNHDANPSARAIRTSEFTQVAVEQLRAGQRDFAVELFRAIAELSPGDADAHNNLGFCLLPEDLDAAEKELLLAQDLYTRRNPVNLANLALVRHLRGDETDALSVIDLTTTDTSDQAAWLWLHEHDTESLDVRFDLSARMSVHGYLDELREEITRT